MIVPDEAEPDVVAGTVTLWPHDFRLLGTRDVPFAGQVLQTNHWAVDPRTDLI